MSIFSVFIGISIAVIALVVYSALVVSSRQERIAQRVREENRFEKAPYRIYSAGGFAFETSDELTDVEEFDETRDVDNIEDIVFNFKKDDS